VLFTVSPVISIAVKLHALLMHYTVSQKKTSPTFLAITRESVDGFL